jgi:hypothetical protein
MVQLFMVLLAIFLLASILVSEKVNPIIVLTFSVLSILPPAVEYSTYVLTEVPALFFLSVSAFLIYRSFRKQSLISALFSGFSLFLAILIRPDYQFLAPFITVIFLTLAFLIKTKKRIIIRLTMTWFAASIVFLTAYMSYNYINFGYFGTSYFTGYTLSTRTSNVLERLPDEYAGEREIMIKYRNADLVAGVSHTAYSYIHRAIPDLLAYTEMTPIELSDHLIKLNLILIQKAPLNYILEVGRTMANYIMPSTTNRAIFGSTPLQALWAGIHFGLLLLYFLFLAFLMVSSVLFIKADHFSRKRVSDYFHNHLPIITVNIFCVTVVAYCAFISSAASTGTARYHVPSFLLALVNMSFLLNFLIDKKKKISFRLT